MGDRNPDWSEAENRVILAAYFDLQAKVFADPRTPKKQFYVEVSNQLNGSRNYKSVEQKLQNISSVLRKLGYLPTPGVTPRSNIQKSLIPLVTNYLEEHSAVIAHMVETVENTLTTGTDFVWDLRESKAPTVEWHPPSGSAGPVFHGRKIDFARLDAENRARGAAGELRVVRYEQQRLSKAGLADLARDVEHVSVTRGDGEGYDVRSFDQDGRERFIEVKTTFLDATAPFYATKNELSFSTENPDQYVVYRLHDFRPTSRVDFFALHGPLDTTCHLDPSQFLARPRVA